VRRWLELLASELVQRMAIDERRWRRAPRSLKLEWRGALRPDQLRDWAAGRVGDRDGLPPPRSRQVMSLSSGHGMCMCL